jgi:hypothetical protein
MSNEEITVRLPKKIMDFIRRLKTSPQEYIEQCVIIMVEAEKDANETMA